MATSALRSLKSIIGNHLSHDSRRRLRDLSYNRSYPPSQFAPLADRLILILGCQRSGNTLTYLMLNAHPSIHGIDESDVGYRFPSPSNLRERQVDSHALLALKFPTKTARAEYVLNCLPGVRIIWPSRNPYVVISSMLQWREEGKDGNWLRLYGANELWQHSFLFPEILDLDVDNMGDVALGAHIWAYKERTLDWCRRRGLPVCHFRFESLLENPGEVMGSVVDFVGLDWDDRVLRHEESYSPDRKYPGGTDGSKAVDESRKSPDIVLSGIDVERVAEICGQRMQAYGYRPPENRN